jgi:pyruvate/2-oxoglutarate dehydrogenase complex dihydrolipoamide dehydrogenase (E3) component/rhodanese-related sulfurtransferase
VDNIIIIGGMAAGCKAAARLRRLSSDYKIFIIEQKPFVSFCNCGLPLYASGEVDEIYSLEKTPYGVIRNEKYFEEVKDIKVYLNTQAKEINNKKKEIVCYNSFKNETFTLGYDKLLIATGSEPLTPQFPYPSSPLISSVYSSVDLEYFRNAAQKEEIEKAIIIGGGPEGCAMIEALNSLWGIDVTLIESEKFLLKDLVDSEISCFFENNLPPDKVNLILRKNVTRIELDAKNRPVVFIDDGQIIETDYVFYCLGAVPNTKLAEKAGIRISKAGGIFVDSQMRTNQPDIWAAGDCVAVKNLITNKQSNTFARLLANKLGRIAADSIGAKESRFKGYSDAFSLAVFNTKIFAAGLTENIALDFGFETATVIGSFPDRADYDPEVKTLIAKLVYEKSSMKLLGLQIAGEGEGKSFVDVFSLLLSQGKTVYDLISVEQSCDTARSLPFSILNYLAFMAINQEEDGIKNIDPVNASSFQGTFIDLREKYEIDLAPFPEDSIYIPLAELNKRMRDFDLDQELMFVCGKGPRGYEAARLFKNKGYKNVSYLGAGSFLYNKIIKSQSDKMVY